MKLDIPLSQNPFSAPFRSLGEELLDNFYLEMAQSLTARNRYYQIGRQGLDLMYPMTASNACRGMYTTSSGRSFGVYGMFLYEITGQGTARSKVGQLKTYSGTVRFADNGNQMILVDGQFGYIFELVSNTFQRITDTYFPGVDDATHGPSHVCCINTYFIVNSTGTNRYYWSSPGYVPYAFDSTHPDVLNLWNGLQYGVKGGDSGNILGLIANGTQLGIFGATSMEYHYDTGNTQGQLFARIEGAFVNWGLLAPQSLCRYEQDFLWVGTDKDGTIGAFTAGPDYQPKRVSVRGLEARMQIYQSLSDAISTTFFIDGHGYVMFTFPNGTSTDGSSDTNGATWCYDTQNGTWTRRTRWDNNLGQSFQWQAQYSTYNWGKILMGDQTSDALYQLDTGTFADTKADNSGIWYHNRIVTTPIGWSDGVNMVYRSIQLNMQQGMGLRNGQGSDPKALLSISMDGGFTYGHERSASIGKTGQYGMRTRWTKCGTGRVRQERFRITEPIQVIIVGLTVDGERLSR